MVRLTEAQSSQTCDFPLQTAPSHLHTQQRLVVKWQNLCSLPSRRQLREQRQAAYWPQAVSSWVLAHTFVPPNPAQQPRTAEVFLFSQMTKLKPREFTLFKKNVMGPDFKTRSALLQRPWVGSLSTKSYCLNRKLLMSLLVVFVASLLLGLSQIRNSWMTAG